MNDKVVLYTIGCPQCIVLEEKLKKAGIQYEVVNNKESIIALGITTVPTLQIGDRMITSLSEANNWIRKWMIVNEYIDKSK